MNADVVLLPSLLDSRALSGRAVVVFDVLRATTTIAAALSAGVESIHIFGSIADATAAAASAANRPILCGEVKCLPPAGFDLGNSPRQFSPGEHAAKTIYLSTTNGTRALVAARSAAVIFAGAVVNASAVATAVITTGLDVTLLCAGTDSRIALEDVIGAGAVLSALNRLTNCKSASDAAFLATQVFAASQSELPKIFRQTAGGRNIIAAHLDPDIDFAARLDALNVVGRADPHTLIIRRAEPV